MNPLVAFATKAAGCGAACGGASGSLESISARSAFARLKASGEGPASPFLPNEKNPEGADKGAATEFVTGEVSVLFVGDVRDSTSEIRFAARFSASDEGGARGVFPKETNPLGGAGSGLDGGVSKSEFASESNAAARLRACGDGPERALLPKLKNPPARGAAASSWGGEVEG